MLTHSPEGARAPVRVVVLGASGFLSKHVQVWCRRTNIDVLAVGSATVDLTDPSNASRLAELLRPEDSIVMSSMLTPEKGRDYSVTMQNLRMVETVCHALDRVRCAHFVYLGSDAVYDAHKIPLDEDSTREPIDLYALSHTAREMVLGAELAKSSTPFCILRLTSIYGPGDTHNSYGPNRFVRSAVTDSRIEIFGKGEERRSHVYIKDAVTLIGLVLSYRSKGVLNVATRSALSFVGIAELIIELVGKPISIQYSPRTVPVVHRPYKSTQLFRYIYNLGRPIGPVVHRTFVNSALFGAFPEFSFTPMQQALTEFIAAELAHPQVAFPEQGDSRLASVESN